MSHRDVAVTMTHFWLPGSQSDRKRSVTSQVSVACAGNFLARVLENATQKPVCTLNEKNWTVRGGDVTMTALGRAMDSVTAPAVTVTVPTPLGQTLELS